jgi:hypothetical protein
MPELKRLFLKGRMNKDLDERLVPNGEYRDALNIQVGSSEGSDVGAIENILGNQVARKKRTKQLWADNDASHNYYGLPLDAVCIGAIKDDINDKIYWFITSSTVDCIAEYDKTRDYVQPVLVDTQNVLNFSANKLITGVNLIDNYLFFTDDNSEPKKVDVRSTEFISTDFSTHSTYKGRNFIESDITVIKKSPLAPPSITLANSDRNIQGVTNVITAISFDFSATSSNSGNVEEALSPGDSVSNITLSTPCAYKEGDFLKLTGPGVAGDTDDFEYTVILQITNIDSLTQIDASIKFISPEVVADDEYTYECALQQETPPFEFKFPRFAYRWQYNDNQFSTFSPWTEVAFLPAEFAYDSKTGYNKGMTNTLQLVTLNNFETAPIDVKNIEILYKETNNSTIYVVDSFTPTELTGFGDGFKISSNLIFKVVQSNQLLRPWDNVPRKAKAQEIVGNRIVYANYLQNYTVNENIALKASLVSTDLADSIQPELSVKSSRDYQVGVVFRDEYGRETPVFTSDSATIKVPKTSSATSNKIQVTPTTNAPTGFSYFKYYVKDSSGEYYNLALDRIYKSDDGISAWLSFPSSERNKITEDSYLLLKKGHESSNPIFDTDNKYKILAISNEAPNELTKKKSIIDSPSVGFVDGFGSYINQLTRVAGKTPTVGSTSFLIGRQNGADGITDETKENLIAGNFIRFAASGDSRSQFYKIAKVTWSAAAASNSGIVYVDRPFTDDVNFLYDPGVDPVTLTSPDAVLMEIQTIVDETDLAKFQGKFFVNVEKNNVLINNLYRESNLVGVDTMTFKSWGAPDMLNGNVLDNGNLADTGYVAAENLFIQIWGGGHQPKRTYGHQEYNGGLVSNRQPDWANSAGDVEWDIVFERRTDRGINTNAWARLNKVGQKIKFANHPDVIYTITQVRPWQVQVTTIGNFGQKERLYIKFNKDLQQTVNPNLLNPPSGGTYNSISVVFLDVEEEESVITSNPAIFETEAKELADLNIYYEASENYPISEYNTSTTKTLNWSNVFSFGNGVESNRVRDDFNAPFIDKGTKASTVLEEPYEEERRATGLIYSGIFNSNSGLNDLNQFIQAEKITKDLNPIYGSIQKLHTRDTNLVTLCEDKCLRILANKDALFNADGNTNVTSNNNVLGQAVPFAGEFGISKNPESFASYGYRAYFSDKKRGVVLRLSMDGLTEISNKGMSDYFYDNLKAATTVLGSYDIYSDAYTLTLNNNTVCFKESSDGWPTRKSFIPEYGISLNSDYYTFNNGMIWTHDNENRNTFYEGSTAKSSVQLIFNDNPGKIKNFKTISYEGDSGWIAPLIQTDQQDGAVTTFLDKENIYYNYIRGLGDTWDNNAQSGTLDLKQFAAQGIANLASVETYNGNTTFKVVVKNDPADAETTYTVTEYEVEAEAGDQVNLDVTEFALNIIPNDGYVIDAADFSIGDALPSQINSVVFSNGTGGVVKATCTFDSSFIMPANDVEILIDIDGVANLVGYTVNGQYTISQTNTQESATSPVVFSQTGQEGDEVTLFTKTFTANNTYYYEILPYYYQTLGNARNESNYIITTSYTTSVPYIGGPEYITAATFTVKYIIGAQNETLNGLNFVADAVDIYIPPLTAVVKSYVVNTKAWLPEGGTRTVTFYGDPGAAFTLNIDIDGINGNESLVLEDSGSLSYQLSANANSSVSTRVYTYTLSGNIESPFVQNNPFVINQPSS